MILSWSLRIINAKGKEKLDNSKLGEITATPGANGRIYKNAKEERDIAG